MWEFLDPTKGYYSNRCDSPVSSNRKDSIGTQSLLEEMVKSEGLLYGFVVDDSGVIQYHSDPAMLGQTYSGKKLEGYGLSQDVYEYKVNVPGSSGEMLVIGLSTADFNSAVKKSRNQSLLWSGLVVLIAVMVMWLWSGTFSAAVRNLVEKIEVMATGDFSQPIAVTSRDELGHAIKLWKSSDRIWGVR